MSDSVRPHRRQPTRLPCPWDSPGKSTGVGCHFLLQCIKVKSESEVTESCPTLSDSMNCSLPGSSVHGIFQARVLEWGAIAFSMKRCYIYCFCFFTFQNFPSISASFVEPIIPLKLLIPGLPTISLLIYPNRIFFNLQITKLFLRIYDTCPVS